MDMYQKREMRKNKKNTNSCKTKILNIGDDKNGKRFND